MTKELKKKDKQDIYQKLSEIKLKTQFFWVTAVVFLAFAATAIIGVFKGMDWKIIGGLIAGDVGVVHIMKIIANSLYPQKNKE